MIGSPEDRTLLWARFAGLSYLTTMVAGIFALFFVGGSLVIRGDAAATATNVLANESLFRLGFAAELISIAAYVAVVSILYRLLRPVSRDVSFMPPLFGLMGNAILAVNSLNLIVPMFLPAQNRIGNTEVARRRRFGGAACPLVALVRHHVRRTSGNRRPSAIAFFTRRIDMSAILANAAAKPESKSV